MTIQAAAGSPLPAVRGLELPAMLAGFLACWRWQHPGDDTLRRVLPWFAFPLDFLPTSELMERESASPDVYGDDESGSRFFHVYRGSVTGRVGGPWLDAELAFYIAINREPGDDVAIALDYRKKHWTHEAPDNPAVVASDLWTYPGGGYRWRPVAPSFEDFAAMLGIPPPRDRARERDWRRAHLHAAIRELVLDDQQRRSALRKIAHDLVGMSIRPVICPGGAVRAAAGIAVLPSHRSR